jgi:hypothetical protein
MKKTRKPKEPRIEIARSFSFKLNIGNYQSADFFCSAKKEVKESDAEAESQALYGFCKLQVVGDVNAYKLELDDQRNAPARKVEEQGIGRDNAEHDAGAGFREI